LDLQDPDGVRVEVEAVALSGRGAVAVHVRRRGARDSSPERRGHCAAGATLVEQRRADRHSGTEQLARLLRLNLDLFVPSLRVADARLEMGATLDLRPEEALERDEMGKAAGIAVADVDAALLPVLAEEQLAVEVPEQQRQSRHCLVFHLEA